MLVPLDDTQMFVLSRSLMGCLRSASLERFSKIDSPEFEDQLVELLMSQLVRQMAMA
jgi:hypothetical protein